MVLPGRKQPTTNAAIAHSLYRLRGLERRSMPCQEEALAPVDIKREADPNQCYDGNASHDDLLRGGRGGVTDDDDRGPCKRIK